MRRCYCVAILTFCSLHRVFPQVCSPASVVRCCNACPQDCKCNADVSGRLCSDNPPQTICPGTTSPVFMTTVDRQERSIPTTLISSFLSSDRSMIFLERTSVPSSKINSITVTSTFIPSLAITSNTNSIGIPSSSEISSGSSITITTDTTSTSSNSTLVGATVVITVIAILLTGAVVILITFIVINKRRKKTGTHTIRVNSFHVSSQTNIYEEVAQDSSQTTMVPLPYVAVDEYRRPDSGVGAEEEPTGDSDYAIVSDEVSKIQTKATLSSTTAQTMETKPAFLNEEIESDYSLLGEDMYNLVHANSKCASVVEDVEQNTNEVDKNLLEEEGPIYSVVNKNRKSSTSSEFLKGGGQNHISMNSGEEESPKELIIHLMT